MAANPLEPDRINVYEQWDIEATLLAFRGDGRGSDVPSEILHADVQRHQVASSDPPWEGWAYYQLSFLYARGGANLARPRVSNRLR